MERIKLIPPSNRIVGTVEVPGSKSYTNRSLVMASLAKGRSTLRSASLSLDSLAMIDGLRKLGVKLHIGNDQIEVESPNELTPYCGEIDIGPAGTAMRFLTALCCTIPKAEIVLRGSERMHQRPIKPLVDALRRMGATIQYLGKGGFPPLLIQSTQKLRSGSVEIDCSVSSQFASSILLIAPVIEGGLEIDLLGEITSQSYLDMTVQGLHDFGITASKTSTREISVPSGSHYTPQSYTVEGDASGASYLWGLAAVSGGDLTVTNINPNSAQGDIEFPKLLEQMGCCVTKSDRSIRVQGPTSSKLKAITVDMTNMPDTAQTLAVVAATAEGVTTITGLKTLKVKETDRLVALRDELIKVGIQATITDDSITVYGGTTKWGSIKTYDDHRMAMSFSILGSLPHGIEIEEPGVVLKSFPEYWKVLESIGIRAE